MENNYLYQSKQLLQKLENITEWISNNPEVKDANMYEITECLIEFGNTEYLYDRIGFFKDKKICDEIRSMLNSMMDYMINSRKESIDNFTKAMYIHDMYSSFIENSYRGRYMYSNDFKNLICKEISILFYIYGVRRNEPLYQYDNTAEFSQLKNEANNYEDELTNELIKAIENYYKYNEDKKEVKEEYNKKKCYDQIVFSSIDEERRYIEEKSKKFNLENSMLHTKNNNGVMVITQNSLYAVDPIDIHQMAFQKLFRNIDENDIYLKISEVEKYYVDQGNVLIRIVNRNGIIGFDAYIPENMNNYQTITLDRLVSQLHPIYDYLSQTDKDNANNILYSINNIRKKIEEKKQNYISK